MWGTRYDGELMELLDLSRERENGSALKVSFSRNMKHYQLAAGWDRLTEGFRADLGFMPQVDVERFFARGGLIWWGRPRSWLSRTSLDMVLNQKKDGSGNLLEREGEFSLNLQGPMQSSLMVNATLRRKGYEGTLFDQQRFHVMFSLRPSGNLFLHGWVGLGDDIDYTNVQAARFLSFSPEMELFLGRQVECALSMTWRRLEVRGEELFLARLLQTRLIYHFNHRLFVRGILQVQNLDYNRLLYPNDPDLPEVSRSLLGQILTFLQAQPQNGFLSGLFRQPSG